MGAGLAAGAAHVPGTNGDVAPALAVKLIRCSTTLTSEHLLRMPGVQRVQSLPAGSAADPVAGLGAAVTITSTQPESTLREMLALDSQLANLEVVSPALEDAFLALTQGRE